MPSSEAPLTGLSERARWATLLLAIGSLVAGPAATIAEELQWETLSTGLGIALWEPGERCHDEVPSLIILKVDPERFRFATFHFHSEGLTEPVTVQDWQERTGASVVMNSGLFREDYSYLGLLLKDGRSIGGKRHGNWQGLFVAEPGKPGLRKAGILDLSLDPFSEERPVYSEAAQALMLLDRKGKTRVRRSGKEAHQTVIGENGDGVILLIKTTSAAGLWELAECLRSGFPEVRQAMALDGGSSSDLLLAPELAGRLRGDRDPAPWQGFLDGSAQRHIPLPSVIGVFPRHGEGK
jgi:uncharacterized protein YigE (DUF2233 family)